MLLTNAVAQGIADGKVGFVFRRWDAPRVKVGGTQLTRFGVIAIDSVTEVADPDSITEEQAIAAGEPDLARLRRFLAKRSDGRIGRVYRIGVHYAGPDPRLALRTELPDELELHTIDRALRRLDAARSTGPWTGQILAWIRDNPAVVSRVLAALLNRELQPMKIDIRRLKALGLTVSLDVGYRLSPRGAAYLEWQTNRAVPGNISPRSGDH